MEDLKMFPKCLAIPWNPALPLQLDHVMQTSIHGSLASLLLCWCLAALWFSVSFHGHAIFIYFHTFILGPRNARLTNYSIHFIHIYGHLCSLCFLVLLTSLFQHVPTTFSTWSDALYPAVHVGACSRLYIYLYTTSIRQCGLLTSQERLHRWRRPCDLHLGLTNSCLIQR